jgi:hypothetical protein
MDKCFVFKFFPTGVVFLCRDLKFSFFLTKQILIFKTFNQKVVCLYSDQSVTETIETKQRFYRFFLEARKSFFRNWVYWI